jgi:hypothetical protein
MMKKLTLFLTAFAILTASALAQDLPRIAVYVTGEVPENEKRALGTRMLASLINSGRYTGIGRSGAFLAEIEKQQQSGAMDDSHIIELGRQFDVNYVCITDIIQAFGSWQVSARIVDVESAMVVLIGEAFNPLKSAQDLALVSDEVVEIMFRGRAAATPQPKQEPAEPPAGAAVRSTDMQDGRKTAAPPPKPDAQPPTQPMKPAFWAGIGLDIIGAGVIVYGLMENGNVDSRAKDWDYTGAKQSAKKRNIAYTLGTALLLGGVSVHIFF